MPEAVVANADHADPVSNERLMALCNLQQKPDRLLSYPGLADDFGITLANVLIACLVVDLEVLAEHVSHDVTACKCFFTS